MIIKRVGFLQMTGWEKINFVVFFFGGVGFIPYAVCDFVGLVPEMKLRLISGEYLVVPHWVTGSVVLLFASISLFFAHIVRTRFVDRWEGRFNSLLREVEDDLGNLPH